MVIHRHLFIPGPAGRLQAIYEPREDARAVVVVCHPHPRFGGTMRNKVVYAMACAFSETGCAVLRFNFRGVEQSEGSWDAGRGEAEDARAALDWMAGQHSDVPLWLAGFSFGCYAGLRAARHDLRVVRLFAVAPAVNHWDFSFMRGDARPLTVVMGTADEIVPFEQVRAWNNVLEQARLHPVDGAGHFFTDHIKEMKQTLLSA